MKLKTFVFAAIAILSVHVDSKENSSIINMCEEVVSHRLTRVTEVDLWATWYFVPKLTQDPNGIEVRDFNNKKLGIKLALNDWCQLAMEGSAVVDGKMVNYHRWSSSYYVKGCQYSKSGGGKFYLTNNTFAVGNKDNELIPFRSIACDQKRYMFGQGFYIPEAVGTLLPDGTIHDGKFTCGDIGGKIKQNHIDIYLGTYKKNPFSFVTSNKSGTFKAYLTERM